MMVKDEIENIENSSRELRLTEQAIFRGVIESKNKKFKKLLLVTIISFMAVGVFWLAFHCIPLVLQSQTG